jgi:hypothetical protein
MEITTNQNLSPENIAAGTSTLSSFLTATSSAAIGDNNNLSLTSSKKRAFVPDDPALGGHGAEMGAKKAKKENDKIRAEEIKEKRFNELKSELREQTKTQKRLVRLFELRARIKTAMMTKNKKLLKEANDEMAKFLGLSAMIMMPMPPTMTTTTMTTFRQRFLVLVFDQQHIAVVCSNFYLFQL